MDHCRYLVNWGKINSFNARANHCLWFQHISLQDASGRILGHLWSQIGVYVLKLWKFISNSKFLGKLRNHLCWVPNFFFFFWKWANNIFSMETYEKGGPVLKRSLLEPPTLCVDWSAQLLSASGPKNVTNSIRQVDKTVIWRKCHFFDHHFTTNMR